MKKSSCVIKTIIAETSIEVHRKRPLQYEEYDDIDLEFESIEKKINFPDNCRPYLWRMSTQNNTSHYLLRRTMNPPEAQVSLFHLLNDFIQEKYEMFEHEGEIYLFFMFKYIFKKIDSLENLLQFRAIKLDLKMLEIISASNEDFYKCLKCIRISHKQSPKYKQCAEHWEMIFEPPEICNENDMQLALLKATKYCPKSDIQNDESFIKNIFNKFKDYGT